MYTISYDGQFPTYLGLQELIQRTNLPYVSVFLIGNTDLVFTVHNNGENHNLSEDPKSSLWEFVNEGEKNKFYSSLKGHKLDGILREQILLGRRKRRMK